MSALLPLACGVGYSLVRVVYGWRAVFHARTWLYLVSLAAGDFGIYGHRPGTKVRFDL